MSEQDMLPEEEEQVFQPRPAPVTGNVVDLRDEFKAPEATGGKSTAVCADGLTSTLIRYTTGNIAQARAAGIYIVEFGDCLADGQLLVENQGDFPRTKEGYLQQWDCIIGIETVAHKAKRAEYINKRASDQLKAILGEDKVQTSGTPSDLLALVLSKLTPDKQEALLRAMVKSD